MRANKTMINRDLPNSKRARGITGITDPTTRLRTKSTPQVITIAMITASSLLRIGFASQAITNTSNHAPHDHTQCKENSGSIYEARYRTMATQSAVVGEKNPASAAGDVRSLKNNRPAPATIAPPASKTTRGLTNLRDRSYATAPELAAANAAAVIG